MAEPGWGTRGPQLVQRLGCHSGVAIRAREGSFTYRDLLEDSSRAAAALLLGRPDLAGGRVAFLVEPSYPYVVTLLGAWRAGGIAVPVGTRLPPPEIEYLLDDAQPAVTVASDALAHRLEPLAARRGIPFLRAGALAAHPEAELPAVEDARASMMLYTSGTTGRPKGVVHTHASIAAQIRSLVEAWRWSPEDRILLVLPLHHVHGIVNVLCCALWTGAVCEVLPSFDAAHTWERIAAGELTLFMAVPTIYRRLIDAWEAADPDQRARMSAGARRLRLMVSGSAALPVPVLERWREITGHTLLERYGMTEIGMALSNTLEERVPGSVGRPLPGVEVRLVGEDGRPVPEGQPGEIQVRGPTVFREYWRRPEATREAFVDGWFRTGDVAVAENGRYRILGRASVDIIKTGGEKVSALEVEDVLRTHPAVADCAVVGVPDPEWGESVCAAVVPARGAAPGELEALRDWISERLASYKVPRRLLVVEELPRNALGKVMKPQVRRLFVDGQERNR